MAWTRIGDISPLYNHLTLVAGDVRVMADWPGAEKAGYPDDEVELPGGSVMVFDLNLVAATVFTDGTCLRLLASLDGKGTKNVPDDVVRKAVEQPGHEEVWGSFEVENGALVLSCFDCATPAEGSAADPSLPRIPAAIPSAPTTIGRTMIVVPCPNGTYLVSGVKKVDAKHEAPSKFDFLLHLEIRR